MSGPWEIVDLDVQVDGLLEDWAEFYEREKETNNVPLETMTDEEVAMSDTRVARGGGGGPYYGPVLANPSFGLDSARPQVTSIDLDQILPIFSPLGCRSPNLPAIDKSLSSRFKYKKSRRKKF